MGKRTAILVILSAALGYHVSAISRHFSISPRTPDAILEIGEYDRQWGSVQALAERFVDLYAWESPHRYSRLSISQNETASVASIEATQLAPGQDPGDHMRIEPLEYSRAAVELLAHYNPGHSGIAFHVNGSHNLLVLSENGVGFFGAEPTRPEVSDEADLISALAALGLIVDAR